MKKADMSIQVIVFAAIALIVLVVLVVIFAGKSKEANVGISGCQGKGGQCVLSAATTPCPEGMMEYPFSQCDKGLKCCMPS